MSVRKQLNSKVILKVRNKKDCKIDYFNLMIYIFPNIIMTYRHS